jgi:hypothetical protein
VAVATSLALLLIYLDRFTHWLRRVAVAALVAQDAQVCRRLRALLEGLLDTVPPRPPFRGS